MRPCKWSVLCMVLIFICVFKCKLILTFLCTDLHEFLTAVYAEYDIMIWSATRSDFHLASLGPQISCIKIMPSKEQRSNHSLITDFCNLFLLKRIWYLELSFSGLKCMKILLLKVPKIRRLFYYIFESCHDHT